MKRMGIISDTHGLLRPEVAPALRGVDHIVHAGDIGDPGIVPALAAIAPVTAIRGNIDRGDWAKAFPETATFSFAGLGVFVIHDRSDLHVDPVRVGTDLVISGHSHRPAEERTGGVLYLNPGSAGPRRFRLPVTLAILTAAAGDVSVSFRSLLPG